MKYSYICYKEVLMINNGVRHTLLLVFFEILTNEVGHKSALSITIKCIEKKSKFLNKFVFLYFFLHE